MNRHSVAFLVLFGAATTSAAGELQFETLAGDKTAIRPAFTAWYDAEMKRQGGPGKSHGWWPWGLRAFDFDGDGRLDLIASHHGTPRSILLRSLPAEAGQFRFANVTRELGVDGRDLPGADDRPWIWDFDGDGWLDIAGFSDESSPKSAWNQKGKGFFPTTGSPFRGVSHPREVLDLNGDGYLDLDGGPKGQWLYVPEKRTFRHEPKPRFDVPKGVPADLLSGLEVHKKANRFFRVDVLTHAVVGYDTLGYDPRPIDLNGDGRGDVVVHGSGGYGAAYLGRYLIRGEDGKLADRGRALGLPEAGAPILIDDLTGDGLPEILIAGEKDSGLYVNDGAGRFQRRDNPLTKFLTRRGPYLLRAYRVDLDNDGLPDLVVSNPRLGLAGVFHNRGKGDFSQALSLTGCWDSNPIALCDLDGDGRMDLLAGMRTGKDTPGEIVIYLNRTKDAGNHLMVLPRMPAPNPYAVGAVVEIFRPGHLGKAGSIPIVVEKAHPDATPVHAGLGKAGTCDVRVTFPGGRSVVAHGVRANAQVIADLKSGRIRPK